MTKLSIYNDAQVIIDAQFFNEELKDFIGRLTYLQSEDDKYIFCCKLGLMKERPRPERIIIEENNNVLHISGKAESGYNNKFDTDNVPG